MQTTNNNGLKRRGEELSGSVVTQAESGSISLGTHLPSVCIRMKAVPRFMLSFSKERATQRGKHNKRVHCTEHEQPENDEEDLSCSTLC